MKNYYNDVERKFTIAKLEFRKFSVSDIIILSVFTLDVIVYFFITQYLPQKKFYITYFTATAAAYFIFTTPFGLRLRNIYFSAIWLVLSLLFLIKNFEIAQIPLLGFFTYHLIRLIFWAKYNKEFIPYEAGKGKLFRYVCKIEGRGGYKEDRFFMKILMVIGFFIFMYGIYTMMGLKIK